MIGRGKLAESEEVELGEDMVGLEKGFAEREG